MMLIIVSGLWVNVLLMFVRMHTPKRIASPNSLFLKKVYPAPARHKKAAPPKRDGLPSSQLGYRFGLV
jgi:hypothetical protein